MANPTIAPYDTGLAGVNQHMNLTFMAALWWSLGLLAVLILIYRLIELGMALLRQVNAMSLRGEQQTFWKTFQWRKTPGLKKHLIYAPLWKKRHNREIRLSSAVNMGTLPSRLHALVLAFYLLSNLAYMFVVNWANENKYALCAEIRGRSGTLAAVNMVPLLILAARNNPLIPLLQISFDTYNLIHRWMGRIIVVEVLIHMFAWLVVQVADGGWASAARKSLHDNFIASGMVGTFAFLLLAILALSPVRHAFYETFLNTHILLAAVVFFCTLVHCVTAEVPGGLPQLPWVIAILSLWAAERLFRLGRVAYCGKAWRIWRAAWSPATVEAMPGEACRVTIHLPRYVDVRPGTHAYLRFREISPWECHPFSIAWVEHTPIDGLPVTEKDGGAAARPTEELRTSVSFVIGAQTGFTRKLYDRARERGAKQMVLSALFEGPYAGHHSLDSYGHAVLIAGATGITHQISYLRRLIEGYNDGTIATRKVTLVWIVRDYESLEWVRPWMDKILRMPGRKELLQIRLFVTRPKNAKQITSASSTVQMFPGRPNIPLLIKKEVEDQVGAMVVTVCGPGALADDVRNACRENQGQSSLSYIEESFTW